MRILTENLGKEMAAVGQRARSIARLHYVMLRVAVSTARGGATSVFEEAVINQAGKLLVLLERRDTSP